MLIWQFVPQECHQTSNRIPGSTAIQELVAQWATIISHWICTHTNGTYPECVSKKKKLTRYGVLHSTSHLAFGGSQFVI